MTTINIAAEGPTDIAIARVIVEYAGFDVGNTRPATGKTRLDSLIPKYNNASTYSPWVVFRDSDSKCPVHLRNELLTDLELNRNFRVRIAHTMVEAWLLADANGFSDFFRVSADIIPANVESIQNPKQTVINLAARSSSRAIREGMTRNHNEYCPLYGDTIRKFASERWNISNAEVISESLRRAIVAIRTIS